MKQPYNTTIHNTALYMRLSRDDESYGDSVSIETQRTILQQYAREQGLHVVGEYVDDGWSGTNFERWNAGTRKACDNTKTSSRRPSSLDKRYTSDNYMKCAISNTQS